jgi:hypothetical protein
MRRLELTIGQILAWADRWKEEHGRWPKKNDGHLRFVDEQWHNIDQSLRKRLRGLRPRLPGLTSLANLLAAKRRVMNRLAPPRLSVKEIRSWVDRFRRERGFFPTPKSGPITWSKGDSWLTVDKALRAGRRGLRKSSLAQLLKRHYGLGRHLRRPTYRIEQILVWVDEHKQRTGKWPKQTSGRIEAAPSENWRRVNEALRLGKRGLVGGSSLAALLSQYRGVRTRIDLVQLSENLIVRWARKFKRKSGRWPDRGSGPIANTGGETWGGIGIALGRATRGLKRKTTFGKLFAGK